jgi:hypothetical protein
MWDDDDYRTEEAENVGPGQRAWLETSVLEKVVMEKCSEYAIDEDEAKDMLDKIKIGVEKDVILALLIANCPNLSSLDMGYSQYQLYSVFGAMLERVGKRVKPFDKIPVNLHDRMSLKATKSLHATAFAVPIDVMVRGNHHNYPNFPDHLAGFFNLPLLRSIYAMTVGDDEQFGLPKGPFADPKPGTCAVSYIELRNSKFHTYSLQRLLNATIPGRLQTFSYEIGCSWTTFDIDHPAIMQSLEAHHATLESLGLSHTFYPFWYRLEGDKPYAVSFTPFTALRRLKVAPVFIWGHDGLQPASDFKRSESRDMLWKALPGNLEQLWIARAEHQHKEPTGEAQQHFIADCLLPSIERLVHQKAIAFPQLKELRVEIPPRRWKPEWFESLAAVCTTAEEHGIRCTVILVEEVQNSDDHVERRWGWDEDVVWGWTYLNQGPPKRWITARDEENLAEVMKSVQGQAIKV